MTKFRFRKPSNLIAASFLLVGARVAAFAQEPAESESIDPEIAAINKKYDAEYKKLEDEGNKLSERAPKGVENTVGIDVDFSKMHDISFDVPEFRMKRQKIAFDIPTGTMKTRRIVWHNPEVTMENKKVGQYPEFHGLTVRWKDIITKVPVTKMVKREAKLDIPEFKMKRTDISFDIPEIFRTRRVQLRVPEFKARTTASARQEVEAGSHQIEESAKSFAVAQRSEIIALASKRLSDQRANLETERKKVLSDITTAIEQAKKAGANPAELAGENGDKVNLINLLETTSKQFSDGLAQIDAAILELQKQADAKQVRNTAREFKWLYFPRTTRSARPS